MGPMQERPMQERDASGILDMDTPRAEEVGASQVFVWVPEFNGTSLLRYPSGKPKTW